MDSTVQVHVLHVYVCTLLDKWALTYTCACIHMGTHQHTHTHTHTHTSEVTILTDENNLITLYHRNYIKVSTYLHVYT